MSSLRDPSRLTISHKAPCPRRLPGKAHASLQRAGLLSLYAEYSTFRRAEPSRGRLTIIRLRVKIQITRARRRWTFRREGQLQTWQRPVAQRQADGIGPVRRGPQRRTHSIATVSVRSPIPPGQQEWSIAKTSRSVSGSARVQIDSICASTSGSPGLAPITDTSTRWRRGLSACASPARARRR